MLVQRDVIRFAGDNPRTFRVVWVDNAKAVLFDLDAKRTSFAIWSRITLEGQLNAGDAKLIFGHGYNSFHFQSALTGAQHRRGTALMAMIAPLLDLAPEIFDDRTRGKAIAAIDRNGGKSAKTMHVALDRYWRKGMSPDALIPNFRQCGRSERRADTKKPGRKKPMEAPPGVPVTPEIEAIFDKAVTRFYVSNEKNALTKAFALMKAEAFVDEIKDTVDGEIIRKYKTKPEWVESGFPTMRQFRYWYNKRPDVLSIKRKRVGPARYEKDMRGTTSNSVASLLGPGSRFEIDSTPLDVAAVSMINRMLPVGRPTFYQVSDVFSKLVCGIYVGLEAPSWLAAGLAVQNVVEDKVAFAKGFGVSIEPYQWPCSGVLPARLLADRGEFKHDASVKFNDWSKTTVEIAAPYRGDMKGTVERKFGLFHTELATQLTAVVRKRHGERGEADYRREAILDLREITAAVIETVILLNARKLVDYPRSRELIAAGIFAVPRDMWAWGVEKDINELRPADPAETQIALLPSGTAVLDQKGYRFKTLHYRGTDAHADIFAIARQKGVTKAAISYHLLHTTNIYLHDPITPNKFIVLTLTPDSEAFADISFEEVAKLREEDRLDTLLREPGDAENLARYMANVGGADKAARKERPKKLAPKDLAGMKQNRKDDRERERQIRHPKNSAVTPVIDTAAATAARAQIATEQGDALGDDGVDALFS